MACRPAKSKRRLPARASASRKRRWPSCFARIWRLAMLMRMPSRQQSEHWMGIQSVALAGGHLLLAAWAEGLGGVWMCAPLFAQAAASQALDLPGSWQPQALILLGYPAKSLPLARAALSMK